MPRTKLMFKIVTFLLIISIRIYVPLNAIIAYAKPLLQLEQDFLTLDLLMKQKSLNK